MRIVEGGVLTFIWACLLAAPVAAAAAPLGEPGTVGTYRLQADPAQRPEFERTRKLTVVSAQLQLGPVVRRGGRQFQWAGLSFTRLNGQTYQAWLLMDAWPRPERAPQVIRYLWCEPEWPDAVTFLHETTGVALLPRLSLWEYGWPRTADGKAPLALKPGEPLPARIQLQGWPFRREKLARQAAVAPPAKRTVVKLNPDLLIGFSFTYRDTEGRHRQAIGKEQHEYVETSEEDWRKDIAAGFNVHQSLNHASWLWREGVYSNRLYWLPDDWPAYLYRPNYWGRAMYVDEPAIHYRAWANSREELAGKLTPAESAKMLEARAIEPLWKETGNYSALWFNHFVDQRFGRGNLTIVERDYPVWEAIWHTAWYQLAPDNGVAGLVDEDFYPEDLVEAYNRAFGTQIPATLENACAIRVAVLRGACRNFGKKWGTAIYSYTPEALNPKLDQTQLRYMYEAGATYFWFWNCWPGLSDAHVPYSYKRAYAAAVRQAYKENPKRDLQALLHAAKVCIVLPYGYTFAPFPLQYVKWLHLERKTEAGTTYRQVLANAATEVERCLREGVKFDIAIDEPRFRPKGYTELIYVREDGTLRLVRPGQPDRLLRQPRTPERPDLGPPPSVTITVVDAPAAAPCTLKLKATATPGTGELAGGITWEVFLPGGDFRSADGEELAIKAERGGTYRVRAAVTDCFGRPAIAWSELTVTETRRDISTFPEEWLFRKDPQQVGEAEGWFQVEAAEDGWQRIPVPRWWEETAVGAYDGVAWYRVRVPIPAEARGKPLRLLFGAVDEEAWVYLNGRLIGEHSCQSTGKGPNDLWEEPFAVVLPAEAVRFGEENVLVVRVNDSGAAGGIYKPVRLVVEE